MSLPALEIPPLDCPAVLLPTPANLNNMFGNLAAFPGKLTTLAKTTAKEEAEQYIKQAEDLQNTLDGIRTSFSAYDPKFKKISIPEKEWEIMIQRLIEEYPTYIQAQILDLCKNAFPIPLTFTLLGLEIDVIKIVTDRNYLTELLEGIDGDKIDELYALIPSEYKYFQGDYGLEVRELKKKQIVDFINNEVAKFMNGGLFDTFTGFITDVFKAIWEPLGLPDLPTPLDIDVKALIDNAIENAKDDAAKLAALKNIKIGPFKVEALLGGDFPNNFESLEFEIARISAKLKEFKEGYQLFLLRQWMGKVTSFFSAIGLSTLTQFATLDFCTFCGLVGIPKGADIDLSSFTNISQVTPINPLGTNEDGTPKTLQSIIEQEQEETGE